MSDVRTVMLRFGDYVFVYETSVPEEETKSRNINILGRFGIAIQTAKKPIDNTNIVGMVVAFCNVPWIKNAHIVPRTEIGSKYDAEADPPMGHQNEYSWTNFGIPDNG